VTASLLGDCANAWCEVKTTKIDTKTTSQTATSPTRECRDPAEDCPKKKTTLLNFKKTLT
jgi:hypothetical protein